MNDATSVQGSTETGQLPDGLAGTIRFLRLLTGLLAGTMIIGLIAIVALLVTRWPESAAVPVLPDGVKLPAGLAAETVTLGKGWALTVAGDEIVVFDPATGTVTQRVRIEH